MHLGKKSWIRILFLILMISFLLSSCSSPKLQKPDAVKVDAENSSNDGVSINAVNFASLDEADLSIEASFSPKQAIKNEIDQLNVVLTPYLDDNSSLFVGHDNKNYIQDFLLKPKNYLDPLAATDWENFIRLLFFFKSEDESTIKMYITDFALDGLIERQYAMSGLMKLLSSRYRLSLGGDSESFKKSDEVADIETLTDTHQMLVRQAYCLGLTDITVESTGLFRPNDYLTRGEAISMFYRIIDSFGPPNLKPDEALSTRSATDSSTAPLNEGPPVEGIESEYLAYVNKLRTAYNTVNQKKLGQLLLAESILNIDEYWEEGLTQLVSLEQWYMILHEVFNLDLEVIKPYLSYETSGTLPYDIAAISIFKLSYLYGGYDIRDATSEELENARLAIPQFDTARDISKFAQMFSSGLLEGLYQIPGFTTKRPVSKGDALLLTKRMIETIKTN